MTRRLLATAGAAACAAVVTLSGAPQQNDQAYRGVANLVSIFATVTDASGRLVTDLDRSDFEVRDNGRRQTLTAFSNARQPFTAVVMLDRSGSMADQFDLTRAGARAFVRALMPEDRVRLGTFANEIVMQPGAFTGDQAALQNVLDHQSDEIGASPVWAAIDDSITALGPASGRRVVLVFTDGHDSPRRGQSLVQVEDIVRHANAADVMIYTVGFWGDDSVVTGGSSGFPPTGPIVIQFPWGKIGNNKPKPRMPSSSSGKTRAPDAALKEIARATAGGYFELGLRDDLGTTFTRVAEELHRQYWLGFAPARLDGKTHKIEVKVKRDGTKVRARETYVAR